MASNAFDNDHAIHPENAFDASSLCNKTIVITGGGSGIGEATLRAFVKAGAFVAFCDISQERGQSIVSELGGKVLFVPCDVTVWADQLKFFKAAIEHSPNKAIDIVFANAGIARAGDLINEEVEENGDPKEPDMTTTHINLIAVMYTAKLAIHYFSRQPVRDDGDKCLVMTASIAGYWDHPSTPQYGATKWGVRGLMRALRPQLASKGMRVNVIAPWYIRTGIVGKKSWDYLQEKAGMQFAEVEDAAAAVLHLASDKSVNGRTLAVVPRSRHKEGYIDLKRDGLDVERMTAGWHSIPNFQERLYTSK